MPDIESAIDTCEELVRTMLSLIACATVDAETTAHAGVEHPAPPLASQVQVLWVEPTLPQVRLDKP
jgi:hypothetical protein